MGKTIKRTSMGYIVIGAVIVKHKMRLSDAETIDYIRENVYVQYFLGKCAYSYESVFTPSLFVYIRNRLALEAFEQMNSFLLLIYDGYSVFILWMA